MKKKKYLFIIVSITIFILICIVLAISFYLSKSNIAETEDNSWQINNIWLSEETNHNLIKSKLEIIKNRLKLKDIISKWDNYFQNDQLWLALIQYKIALNKTPDDYKIIEKIADIYFELKNFKESLTYYEKLINIQWFNKEKYILSLIYSNDILKKSWRESIIYQIEKNINDKEITFFYKNTLFCIEDFHQCKKNFDEKIITDKDNLKTTELNEIKHAIKTYTDFWLVDLYYKNSLIVWAFMKLKLYPISIFLWKKLLEERNDYKAILQIIAQSYFEIWNYEKSQYYLKKYFELTPNDPNAAYLLWIINLKNKEYIISNIFLNKALLLKYNDSINVKRKLAYNYFMLWDKEKMFKTFDDMIKYEKNITKDDVNIIINQAIENNISNKLPEWIKAWIKLFPKEAIFYAYMWKLELDNWKLSLATIYIKKWLKIDDKNQTLNYILWLIYIKENKKEEAKTILQKAYDADKKSNLSKEIKKELDNIS